MSFANSPSCNCCVCNVYTWSTDALLSDWTVTSGTWAKVSTAIVCSAAGELTLNKTLPTVGYAAIVFKGNVSDQTIALRLRDDTNDVVMRITLSQTGVDHAGTVSIKVNGTEKYVTLPATSKYSHDDAAAVDYRLLIHCTWTAEGLRIETGDVPADGKAKDEIGTLFPLAWTPHTLSIVADPFTGDVTIAEVSVDRIETSDEVCIVFDTCTRRSNPADPSPIIPHRIGSIVGRWALAEWDVNRYVSDATVVGDPTASPREIFKVRPHSISITADVRSSGYIASANPAAFSSPAMTLGVWRHMYSIWLDGDAHELEFWTRQDTATTGTKQLSYRYDLYRGATLLGSSAIFNGTGFANQFVLSEPIHLGGERIILGTVASPLIDVATVSTYGGEWVRTEATAVITQAEWTDVKAIHCPLAQV